MTRPRRNQYFGSVARDERTHTLLQSYIQATVPVENLPVAYGLDPLTWDLDESVILDVLNMTDPTKSPGFPLNSRYPTNASLRAIDHVVIPHIAKRLKSIMTIGSQMIEGGHWVDQFLSSESHNNPLLPDRNIAVELVKSGSVDPVLIKIKGEARPIGKKPRLVCMVSVTDTTIARYLNFDLLRAEQSRPQSEINTAVRLDLTTPSETERLREYVASFGDHVSSDIQGWEWSITPFHHFADLIRRLYALQLVTFVDGNYVISRETRKYMHACALIGQCFCSIHRLLVNDDGYLYAVPPGMVSSGEYITFSRNSFIRSWVTVEVNAALTGNYRWEKSPSQVLNLSAGDDNLTTIPTTVEYYEYFGFTVTDLAYGSARFSFCSTCFDPSGSYQEGIYKFFANCMYSSAPFPQLLVACRLGFTNHPDFQRILLLLHEENITEEVDVDGL